MKKELLESIIDDLVTDKVFQTLEDLSTPDFTQQVIECYQIGEDELTDEDIVVIEGMVGDKVFPLVSKITEWVRDSILKG